MSANDLLLYAEVLIDWPYRRPRLVDDTPLFHKVSRIVIVGGHGAEEKEANIAKGGQQECATLIHNRHRVCNLHEPEMMTCNSFMTPLL